MGDEVQELREAVVGLNKKVDELTSGMSIMREMLLRLDASLTKKQKNVAESHIPEAGEQDDSVSIGGEEKDTGRYRKLELPLFAGEDPLGWFFRVERYFRINTISEQDKLEAAIVCLEGKALNWYQWIDTRAPIRNWPEFKRELLRRFHSSQRGGEYELLFAAMQEASVLEYVEEFERLSAPLKEASEECLIGAFRNGLKAEIKAELKLTNAMSLQEIIEAAICVEEKNRILEGERSYRVNTTQCSILGPKTYSAQPYYPRVTDTPKPTGGVISLNTHADTMKKAESKADDAKSRSSSTALTSTSKGATSSKLSDAELARRRELGLCYKCAEKYGPNHVCKNKNLQVFLLEMDAEDDPGGSKNEDAILEITNA